MKKFNIFKDIEGVEFPAGRRGRVMYGENGKIKRRVFCPGVFCHLSRREHPGS